MKKENPVVWFEIYTDDLQRARRFYEQVLDIEISYRVPAGVFDDEVGDALNYRTITKRVIRLVEESRFLLLEKLVADVLEVCSDHPDIIRSEVTIQKPHALRFADSVSLTLEYVADRDGRLNLLEKAS